MDSVADLWPVFGLLIRTPRLRLRLPRENDLGKLAQAARIIAAPGKPQPTGRTEPSSKPCRCVRCPTVLPTWTISRFIGVTAPGA